MAFEKEINDYENLRTKYQTFVVDRMDREEYRQFNEILFSTHSCAIEGNSFSVDDTRELKEKGLGMIPTGKSLLEAFEMLDHFKAYEYVLNNTGHALDEAFLKEINRLVTLHTLAYRSPDARQANIPPPTWRPATPYLATMSSSWQRCRSSLHLQRGP